jgi:hypothetical protein
VKSGVIRSIASFNAFSTETDTGIAKVIKLAVAVGSEQQASETFPATFALGRSACYKLLLQKGFDLKPIGTFACLAAKTIYQLAPI